MRAEDSSGTPPITPLVSVIMPAYNAGAYIEESIRSVQAQHYPHWELWVVDDASADNTGEVAQALAATDPRVHYIRVERLGTPSRVRNVGLKAAKGDYLCFLDSDDLYFPDTLDNLLQGFRDNPQATAVYGFPAYIDAEGASLPQGLRLLNGPDDKLIVPPTYNHTWQNILCSQISCMLPALMLPRTTLNRVGWLNEDLLAAEDYQFYVRLILDGEGPNELENRMIAIPEYVYQYRVYEGSLTKTEGHFQRIMDNCFTIFEEFFGKNGQPGILPVSANQYESQAYTHCYRYHSRERILHRQPDVARALLMRAYRDPHVDRADWMKYCLPLLLRAFLPNGLNDALVTLKWRLRRYLSPTQAPSVS